MSGNAVVSIDGTTEKIARLALDAYELRHRTIAQNVANVDSLDYQPFEVNFEQQLSGLRAALAAGEPTGVVDALISSVHPFVTAQLPGDATADRSERLDDQMVQLVRNTIDYEAMLTSVIRLGALTHAAIVGS
jgi:flagellar basal body rod protein FlgB